MSSVKHASCLAAMIQAFELTKELRALRRGVRDLARFTPRQADLTVSSRAHVAKLLNVARAHSAWARSARLVVRDDLTRDLIARRPRADHAAPVLLGSE